jgi:two-component system sensor histidine kinase QseC
MRSIRSRTLVLVLGVLGLSLSLLSYRSYRDAQHEIEELFDAQLAQSARLLQGMVSHDMDEHGRQQLQAALDEAVSLQRYADDEASNRGHPYESKLGFQVFDGQGRALLQSASAPLGALDRLTGDRAETAGLATLGERLVGYHDIAIGGYRWRLFMLHDSRDDLWILVGEREDVRGELVEKIALRSLLPDLLGLPLLALLVWLAVGWGLRPLASMVQLLKTRDPDNLDPLLLAPLPQELEPMAASLNRLLAQVTDLLEREKRFLADAAHELRTPLAVLRIHAQNALEARDPQERDAALRHLGSGVERATRVVTQLLTLARLEPSAAQLAMTELDLGTLLRDELAELTPLALNRHQELTLEIADGADTHLKGDAPSLATLLQNLVSNAVQYTPEGGQVQVRLEAQPENLVLRVLDSGPGVPAELRGKLFERFVRHGEGIGAGLGLSIVARVVELHRGRIELLDSPLGGLDVRVTLPRSTA